jgi:hypothetical protein
MERGLLAVVRDEEGRVVGEAAPRSADSAASQDGLVGEADQDLLQDLLEEAGEAIRPPPCSSDWHGRYAGQP